MPRMMPSKSWHPERQRVRWAGKDWPSGAHYYTHSYPLAVMALALGREKMRRLGLDPEQLQVMKFEGLVTQTEAWGLAWVGRKPHPYKNQASYIRLVVDWDTLEILE